VAQSSSEVEEHAPASGSGGDGPNAQDDGLPSSTSCALCQASFPNVIEQRDHVRSDFHRYNLKLGLKSASPVDEPTFNTLVGDLDESLSGSEADSESDDSGNEKSQTSTLTVLLRRQAKISRQQENHEESNVKQRKAFSGSRPLLWLSSSILPENISLGVYKALLTEVERDKDLLELITRKQFQAVQSRHSGSGGQKATQTSVAETPQYFLCMVGGGHFAAMIVSLALEMRKGPGAHEERHAIVKAHKTFHRYTTRRKQGGSQSANDNAKGNAHSAGSSIRRYNEMALEVDIRGVLSEWKDMIDKSELLFIRATGTTSRRTLYGPYESQILRANDPRIRGFPFSTRRATQTELMRAFTELTRLKISTVSQAALEAVAADPEKVTRPSKPQPTARDLTPKQSKEDETALMHTTQIETLIRRSKAPALLTYLANNKLSSNFALFPLETPHHHHAPTPLHVAASNNSSAVVLALLVKANADPTLPNGDGKTAFDIAGDTKTRDAFRIARHAMGESAADWKSAHVPPALSEQEAEDRQRREKAQENTEEAERRKADLERLRQQEEAQKIGKIERTAGSGQSLGSRDKTGAEKREEEGRGLTPEMRTKLERERRARAAEERLKRMQGSR
jgi:Bacteroidetes VLRF1 release factor/Ankyrin repeats (many copies)